jgi:serine/threonine protein kinase
MIISNKFQILHKISQSQTQNIFYGKNIITDEEVFIKVQSKKTQNHNQIQIPNNLLKNEAIILNYIKNREGFPTIKYYSSDSENYYLVLSFLDQNLSQLKKQNKNKNKTKTFSIQTILHIGIQLLERIQYFHQTLHLLHRDIKPDNVMIGLNEKASIIHLIDFGFAKKYLDFEKHIHLRKDKEFTGTRNFASLNVLSGFEASRRDDLESIFYTLLYLFLDEEEWNNLNTNFNEKEMKIELLYEKTVLPKVFLDMFQYIRKLEFEETPDYDFLINLFMKNEFYSSDSLFEWCCPNGRK